MRTFLSRLSPNGQITIRAEVRRRLGIKPKDMVAIAVEAAEVRLAAAAFTLESACASVPALPRPLPWGEVVRIAREVHVAHMMAEMNRR